MASFLGQVVEALLRGFGPGEAYDLVGEAVPSSRKISLLDHVMNRIFLHARNEENPVLRPAGEKAVAIVGTIHGNDGTKSQSGSTIWPPSCRGTSPKLLCAANTK